MDVRLSRRNQRPSSMYETREGIGKVPYWHALKNQVIIYKVNKHFYLKKLFQLKQSDQTRSTTQSLYSSPQDRQTVLQCTEQITRTIQQLCKSIQEPDKEDCVASAEKVKYSIGKLASHLPKVRSY